MTNYTSDFSGQHNDEYDARISALLSTIDNQQTLITNLTNRITTLESSLATINNSLNTLQRETDARLHIAKADTFIRIPVTIDTTSSTGMLTVLNYIKTNYPGYQNTWFTGVFSQSGLGWFWVMVYNTSDLHTDGYPRYAWGMAGMVTTYKAVFRHIGYNPNHSWF